jgi:hypothetical protein
VGAAVAVVASTRLALLVGGECRQLLAGVQSPTETKF